MAFKNLSERFEQNMNQLYGKYSTRDGKDKLRGNEPYIEVKPNDPNKRDYGLDERKAPLRSIATDLTRISKWSKSKAGITFYLNQAVLQTGNTFSETRKFNPASIIGNVQPFYHIKRPFSVASDSKKEGRMQKETSAKIIADVLSGKKGNSILKYLPPLGVTIDGVTVDALGSINGILNIAHAGSLDKDQRPEVLLGQKNGDYYSVYSWNAYRKKVASHINDDKLSNVLGVKITKSTTYSANRYFLTSATTSKKYLKNPSANMWSDRYTGNLFTLSKETFGNHRIVSDFGITNDPNSQTFMPSSYQNISENKVADNLQFSDSSLQVVLQNDDKKNEVISDSIKSWLDKNNKFGATPFKGGIPLAFLREVEVNTHSDQRFPSVKVDSKQRKKYFFDQVNSADNVKAISNTTEVSTDMMRQISGDRGNLIDLIFFDVRNKVALPFRAYIRNVQEQISPQFSEANYIGRIERNLTFVSVKRDLSFGLTVHAFNEEEFNTIWKKMNYLSGMCYPAGYDRGYMIPPFIKFTLGDVYSNQPAVFKALSITLEDDTPWEIQEGQQAPHGFHLNVALSILEKSVMQSMIPENESKRLLQFYPVGNRGSDIVAASTSNDIQASDTTTNEKDLPAILRGVNNQKPLSGVNTSNVVPTLNIPQVNF